MTGLKNYSIGPFDGGAFGPLVVAWLGVSFDLIITRLALGLSPVFYESRPFGNNALIYYPWVSVLVLLIYGVENLTKAKHRLSYGYALLPFVAFFHNLIIMGSFLARFWA